MARAYKRKSTIKTAAKRPNVWKRAGGDRWNSNEFLVGYINTAKNPKYKMREIAFNATSGKAVIAYYTGISTRNVAKSYNTKLSQKAMKSIRKYFNI